ncbi:hypothetical protein T4B_2635 [Trichinella pseudospiralis]|uniref:Uncharacterized protein n=1 Tax=Trichinella pseudospiralis TaxID=6337 RepID=A0A0V1IVM5_TRIPS|nr:hypothetical protein T4B_2635 [Trichinella pseudospiralis]KRZ41533.1 hypothetical protein T4C_4646 [Trichinella pseudospiralis]
MHLAIASFLHCKFIQMLTCLKEALREEWMTNDSLPLWNVQSVNIRTNNHLEGWYDRFSKKWLETNPGYMNCSNS